MAQPHKAPDKPKYGRLTVKDRVPNTASYNCVCDCGVALIVEGKNLRHNNTKSCGCLQSEITSARSTTHGLSTRQEYTIWVDMKKRCRNPKAVSFKYYGARGITVCSAWSRSFPQFLADMGPRPTPNHSIERLDNDKCYEPGNCIWATHAIQSRNTRRNTVTESIAENIRQDHKTCGKSITYNELAEKYEVSKSSVKAILCNRQWVKEAVCLS